MTDHKFELSFSYRPFSKEPKHVLIILIYKGKYALTRHKMRGLEFPGGKVEKGESAQEAAVREVYEETGCRVLTIKEIGQYCIPSISDDFVKSIFYAEAMGQNENHQFLETEGLFLFDQLTEEILQQEGFSFIMQDGVVCQTLLYLKNNRV